MWWGAIARHGGGGPGAPSQRKFLDYGEVQMGFSEAWGE